MVMLSSNAQDTTIRRAGTDSNAVTNLLLRSFDTNQFTTNGGVVRVKDGALITNIVNGNFDFINGDVGGTDMYFTFRDVGRTPQWHFRSFTTPSIILYSTNGGYNFKFSLLDDSDGKGYIELNGSEIGLLTDNNSLPAHFNVGQITIDSVSSISGKVGFYSSLNNTPMIKWADTNYFILLGQSQTTSQAAQSEVETSGSFGNHSITVSGGGAAYVALSTDHIIYVVASGGTKTVTVPAASAARGRTIEIKDKSGNAAANNITVNTGGGNIDGAASRTMNVNFQNLVLRSDGTNWFVH